jgi:hypothetical protein
MGVKSSRSRDEDSSTAKQTRKYKTKNKKQSTLIIPVNSSSPYCQMVSLKKGVTRCKTRVNKTVSTIGRQLTALNYTAVITNNLTTSLLLTFVVSILSRSG